MIKPGTLLLIPLLFLLLILLLLLRKRDEKSPSALEETDLLWNQRLKPLQQEEKSALKQNCGTRCYCLTMG
ncbi:hypothetical protein Oscil6304_3297 [Oscillatoria acuminata PCC 6304]|uniref:Uncharacterized protein n=1 Tax=Oscillatoria acuminata PCC 6304 TaxID=56110 RepID=K9TJ63_9CYAN|nr:hypothetical protein Oscil6304_3297 [Oscillatoria acuminata PCC 6304]